jgi:hypothetical protein
MKMITLYSKFHNEKQAGQYKRITTPSPLSAPASAGCMGVLFQDFTVLYTAYFVDFC